MIRADSPWRREAAADLLRAGGLGRATRPGAFSLWAHLRIKPERFDISGGWVNDRWNSITNEVFLKTLKRLHVNTAHLQNTRGYTDTDLYTRYPLKYFGHLQPVCDLRH